jgi:2-oxo-4-hydroxy-4-carboxy-5-ureidoimidazoline decarboxylase
VAEPHVVLNGLDHAGATAALTRACGSRRWVERMLQRRPFSTSEALYAAADEEWRTAKREDYLEAFSHHPRIGEDMAALRRRFEATAALSTREQAGVADAGEATLRALRDANASYFERFGFIFIICATGKSAA